MTESRASRRLVKSPPELWSEVSNAASLQRHLDRFGDIRITKLEPETGVAWEGEYARGTIMLEPSGWGTRVTLTAQPLHAGSDDVAAEHAEGYVETTQQDARRGQSAREAQSLLPVSAKGPVLPYSGVGTEIHEFTAFVERTRREAEMRKRRWPRRLTQTFRRWFAPQSGEDINLMGSEEPLETPAPSPSAASFAAEPKLIPVSPESTHLDVYPEPADVASAVNERAPDGEAEPEAFPAQLDALNAALDSLGRAHHRPYSRA